MLDFDFSVSLASNRCFVRKLIKQTQWILAKERPNGKILAIFRTVCGQCEFNNEIERANRYDFVVGIAIEMWRIIQTSNLSIRLSTGATCCENYYWDWNSKQYQPFDFSMLFLCVWLVRQVAWHWKQREKQQQSQMKWQNDTQFTKLLFRHCKVWVNCLFDSPIILKSHLILHKCIVLIWNCL